MKKKKRMSSSERLRNEKYFFYKYAKENKTKNLKKAVKTEIEKKTTRLYIFYSGLGK